MPRVARLICVLGVLSTGSAFFAGKAAYNPKAGPLFAGTTTSTADTHDLYLGIDCGTQGLKALVYDAGQKKVLSVGSVSYGLLPSEGPEGKQVVGRAEQDPAVWVDALVHAANAALDAADAELRPPIDGSAAAALSPARASIRGVGVSGQQHGLVALDEDRRVIRPAKLWCDTESAAEARELSEALGWPWVASPGFTSTKLLWLKRNEPENFARMAHACLPHDYLNMLLTGELVGECGDASGTGLLDLATRQWHPAACALVDPGLLAKLPRLVEKPTDPAGFLKGELAEESLGLPRGTPVSCGGGDNMMSALGCGCTVEGRAAISLGTSGTIFAKTAGPPPSAVAAIQAYSQASSQSPSQSPPQASPQASSRASSQAAQDAQGGEVCPFLDATGGGLPLLCTLNCASVPEEVVAGTGLSRDELTALATEEPVGCEGLTLVPYLVGERTPNWPDASGALVGLRPGHLARPGLLYRAALEGVAFSLKQGLRGMGPMEVEEVRLVGGGSRSALWRQVIADALGVTVALPAEAESAALGAAIQAAGLVAARAAAAGKAGQETGKEAGFDLGRWAFENHDAAVSAVVEPSRAHDDVYAKAFALYEQRAQALFGGVVR